MHPALQRIVDFASSRPVLNGAPIAAALGLALGGVFYVGPQLPEQTEQTVINPSALQDDGVVPIGWPGGKVPDYVVGTDFLAMTRPPQPIYVAYTEEPPPPPEPPVFEVEAPRAAPPSAPQPDRQAYASTQGDILDIRLPEDRAEPAETVPVVMAQASPMR